MKINDLQQFTAEILELLQKNKENFQTFLNENFKSYDGFISFYSHHLEDWTQLITDHDADAVIYASIFDFLIKNETPEIEYNIYENLNGNGYNVEAYAAPEPKSLENWIMKINF